MPTPTNIRCPACQGSLIPSALHCNTCDLTVTGNFVTNEFASLGQDDLHLLRIFVHCEGRIRDMESALGVSYPTIKTRLAKLKETLAIDSAPLPQQTAEPMGNVIKELDAGRVSFEDAMERLKRMKPGEEK
jgi:hypothetical protein